jgi:hypothetical protein
MKIEPRLVFFRSARLIAGVVLSNDLDRPDPDDMFAKAIAADALEICAVEDVYAWRLGRVVDPFGHHWEIGRLLASETSHAALSCGRIAGSRSDHGPAGAWRSR